MYLSQCSRIMHNKPPPPGYKPPKFITEKKSPLISIQNLYYLAYFGDKTVQLGLIVNAHYIFC